MRRIVLTGALSPLLLATCLAAQTPATRTTQVTAAPDRARAIDAEVRIAMFDLLSDRPLASMSRLGFLGTLPDSALESATSAGMYGTEDVRFLLAESYLRLGMSNAFRGVAAPLVAQGDSRYAGILRLQLMVDAYRRGDYQQAATLAEGAAGVDRGLAGLVGGLAHYHIGNFGAARTAFEASAQTAGIYTGYSRYMGALAAMAGDTAQTQAALGAMQALSQDALGELADQVNLTVAELAYQQGQYDVAAQAAARIQPESGLSAMATLTHAWSLYKNGQLDESASAFRDFATRFPQLPQRDEARLMIGQVMLEQGRIDEAGGYFQGIADSLTLEISSLRERGATAVQEAARSFVAARAAALLFLTQPQQGKSLALNDDLGMDLATVAAALGQTGPVTPPARLRPEIVSLADIEPRLDSVTPASSLTLSHRVVYIAGDSGSDHSEYVRRSQALREADVGVALARYRLAEQLDSHNAKLALVEALQELLGRAVAQLDTTLQQLTSARDSLARLVESSAATEQRLQELMRLEAQAVLQSARENSRKADSLRASFGTMLTADDSAVMEIEARTAVIYRELAQNVVANLAGAFANHPVMRLQDSVRAHLAQTESLVDQTRVTIAGTNEQLSAELARLRANQAEASASARTVVANAEARRAQAESELIAAVEAELRSRAGRLLALVQHDAEAAEFGAASASFFKAVGSDTTRTSNPPAGENR